jgi:hypothetical protein
LAPGIALANALPWGSGKNRVEFAVHDQGWHGDVPESTGLGPVEVDGEVVAERGSHVLGAGDVLLGECSRRVLVEVGRVTHVGLHQVDDVAHDRLGITVVGSVGGP